MRSKRGKLWRWTWVDSLLLICVLIVGAWALYPVGGPDLSLENVRQRLPQWLGLGTNTELDSLPDTTIVLSLRELPSSLSNPIPSYSRDSFGQRWADVDRNGCDTRNDILARDLARPIFKEGTRGCVVVAGTLAEPYTGEIIEFQRGADTSALVHIDHVVALADAWSAGASRWDLSERERFANDPLNLLAVDGDANQDKSAARADQWLPPDEGFRCAYVARQVAVKSTWNLSVTDSERQAMANVLASCPDQPMPR